jgi:GntR family transcriptional regulator
MHFVVASGAELPIYRQLMRQITDAIAGGRLRAGDKLSSQRELAEQLVISPLTVKKAYDELEREGLIRSERGRGTFVTAGAVPANSREQRERLRDEVRRLLSRAHLGGVSFEELSRLLDDVHAELKAKRKES